MDNNQCLLLEFINEDKKIAVGYQDWLQDKISGKEEYLNIIKKKSEVIIKWPNCDIAPASIMKKRVRTCEWNTVVAKILSFGEWTKMCQQRDNLETYGVLEATKEQRKSVCRKQWSNDEESEDDQRKKKYKKSGMKCMNAETKSSLWTELKTRKYVSTVDSEQSSSDDDSSSKISQQLIQENNTLKKENDDLKNENVALRVSLACIES